MRSKSEKNNARGRATAVDRGRATTVARGRGGGNCLRQDRQRWQRPEAGASTASRGSGARPPSWRQRRRPRGDWSWSGRSELAGHWRLVEEAVGASSDLGGSGQSTHGRGHDGAYPTWIGREGDGASSSGSEQLGRRDPAAGATAVHRGGGRSLAQLGGTKQRTRVARGKNLGGEIQRLGRLPCVGAVGSGGGVGRREELGSVRRCKVEGQNRGTRINSCGARSRGASARGRQRWRSCERKN